MVTDPRIGTNDELPVSNPNREDFLVFCKAVVCVLMALPTVAQAQSFVTITIRPAPSTEERVQVRSNGEWTASGVSVNRLMNRAYGMPGNGSPRFSPLPNWTLAEKYDINATAPANIIHPSLQDSEVRSLTQQMIREMLADRFGLVEHPSLN